MKKIGKKYLEGFLKMLSSVINWPKKSSKMYGNITVGWQTSHLSLEKKLFLNIISPSKVIV